MWIQLECTSKGAIITPNGNEPPLAGYLQNPNGITICDKWTVVVVQTIKSSKYTSRKQYFYPNVITTVLPTQ